MTVRQYCYEFAILNLYYLQYGAVICCDADGTPCDVKYSKTKEKNKSKYFQISTNGMKLFMHQ